ncbi:MAG: thioredoxin [Candidatus Methanofastidiosia archaeon]
MHDDRAQKVGGLMKRKLGELSKLQKMPLKVEDKNLKEILQNHSLVLLDFFATWCYPCKLVSPTVKELARKYHEKLLVGKLNVDENPLTASRYGVFTIPTLILFENGVERERIVGAMPRDEIEKRILKYLKR